MQYWWNLFTTSFFVIKASATRLNSVAFFLHVNLELQSMVSMPVPETNYSEL